MNNKKLYTLAPILLISVLAVGLAHIGLFSLIGHSFDLQIIPSLQTNVSNSTIAANTTTILVNSTINTTTSNTTSTVNTTTFNTTTILINTTSTTNTTIPTTTIFTNSTVNTTTNTTIPTTSTNTTSILVNQTQEAVNVTPSIISTVAPVGSNSLINWNSSGQGTLIDSFNATDYQNNNNCIGYACQWDINYGVPANAFSNNIQVNTTTWVQGGSSVSLTLPPDSKNPSGAVAILKNVNINLKNAANFYYWFYIQNSSELNNTPEGSYGVSLQFENASNVIASCDVLSAGVQNNGYTAFQNGWTPIVIARSACNAAPTFWATNVIQIQYRISLDPSVTHNVTVNIDNLRENYGGGLFNKAQVILTFDGSWNNTLLDAEPILKQNHQSGVAYIVTNEIGENETNIAEHNFAYDCGLSTTSGNAVPCITANQLTILYNDGWDISSHTTDHADLVNRTADDLHAIVTTNEINFDSFETANSFKTLSNLAFGASSARNTAQFFAYPNGAYNSLVISQIESQNNYTIARTLNLGITQPNLYQNNPYNLSYRVQSVVLTPDNDLSYNSFVSYTSQVIGYTNNVIPENGLLVLTFHIIQSNSLTTSCESAGVCYPTALFKNISDYLEQEQCMGLLQVTNFTAYYNVVSSGTGGNTTIPSWCTPTISISPLSANINVGQSVSFTNITTNGIAPYMYKYTTNAPNSMMSGNSITFLTAGTYNVLESVTDNTGVIAYSTNAIITVDPAPIITISPSSANIDIGQSVTFTNTTTDVKSPFTYTYTTNAPSNTISGNKATFLTAGTYYVFESLTDNSGITESSTNAIIKVSSAPKITISPLSNTISTGQSVTFTNLTVNGTKPFKYTYITSSNNIVAGNTITFPTAGTYNVLESVTDNAGVVAYSTNTVITVTSQLKISIAPLSSTIIAGQSVTFTNVSSGSSAPFTYSYTTNASGAIISGNTITFPSAGNYSVSESIKSSTGANALSTNAIVTVIPNTTTTTIGGGGGSTGGGGGGGGGSSAPVLSYGNNCAIATNVAVPNSFTFIVANQTFTNVVDNYIGPNYTSVIVNGVTYTLNLNATTPINGTSIYMKLINVSYLPISHTVTLFACPNSNNNVFVTQNTTKTTTVSKINISLGGVPLALVSIHPSNLTGLVLFGNVSNLPTSPNGLTVYSAMNISINNITNATTLNITAKLQCGLNNVQPYILKNNVWVQITPFSLNTITCTLNFTIPADPIVAIMYQASKQVPLKPTGSAATTTIAAIPITSTQQKSAMSEGEETTLAAVLVIILVIAFIGGFYAVSHKKRPVKKKGNKRV
jgi:plastocyanin/peptidoglycan/xylan/chitin deacetylase (PgdA/CDA1 family)